MHHVVAFIATVEFLSSSCHPVNSWLLAAVPSLRVKQWEAHHSEGGFQVARQHHVLLQGHGPFHGAAPTLHAMKSVLQDIVLCVMVCFMSGSDNRDGLFTLPCSPV